ncbi:MAG: four helix bundle protein [Bacteroidia bacterium]|nr:four helix bundle protein [Bacteroidia bacterium]
MKIQRFEGIIAWQRVKDLEVSIYTEFSGNKDFGFKDQIQRSNSTIGRNLLLSTFDF